MQPQLKLSEGKPSEYLLLNEATAAATSHGQMHKADELRQRSAAVSDRLGFKETTADTQAAFAPCVQDDRGYGESQSRVSGFLCAMEGRRPGCAYPERSAGGIREAAIAAC